MTKQTKLHSTFTDFVKNRQMVIDENLLGRRDGQTATSSTHTDRKCVLKGTVHCIHAACKANTESFTQEPENKCYFTRKM